MSIEIVTGEEALQNTPDTEDNEIVTGDEYSDLINGLATEPAEGGDPEPEPSTDPEPEDLYDVAEATGGLFADESELEEFAENLEKDQFFKGLFEYWKQTGDVSPYLNAYRVDYDQVSDEQLLREQFDQEMEGIELTNEELDAAFAREVLSKYSLDDPDGYDDLEKKIGAGRLKKDADKLRTELKGEQAKFSAPAREEQPQSTPAQDERDQIKVEAKARKMASEAAPDGNLKFKVGEDEYSVPFAKESIVPMLSQAKNMIAKVSNGGNPDMRVLAAINNMDEFVAKIANDATARAKAEFIDDELRNKPKPNGATEGQASPEDMSNPYSKYNVSRMKVVN